MLQTIVILMNEHCNMKYIRSGNHEMGFVYYTIFDY